MHDVILHIPIKEPLADSIIALAQDRHITQNNPISRILSFLNKGESGYEINCRTTQIEEVIASLLSVMIAANDLINTLEEQQRIIEDYKEQLEEMNTIIRSCLGKKTDKMN